MVKFVALAVAFTLLPLAYLIWYWRELRVVIKAMIVVYLVVMFAGLYPVSSFLFSMTRIEQVFPKDCNSAIRLAQDGISQQYSSIYIFLVEKLFGFTPNYYFFSTIGICELKKTNYQAATLAFEKALADSDSLDLNSRQKLEEGLKKARARLNEARQVRGAEYLKGPGSINSIAK
jgi:hypothetical protein